MGEREQESTPANSEGASEDSSDPLIHDGALRGIDDVEDGNTANKSAIQAALEF